MPKCNVCHTNHAIYAWQPFGPDDNKSQCATLGNHYRGFPVIKLCQTCHDDMIRAATGEYNHFVFCYRDIPLSLSGNTITECPF